MARFQGRNKKGDIRQSKKSVLNDGPPPKKITQGQAELLSIDLPEVQELIEKIYEYLKNGMRSNEIYAMLCVDDPTLTDIKFNELCSLAYGYAEIAFHKDREYTFQLHMERYEKLYFDSLSMENSWHQPLDPKKDWSQMLTRYGHGLQALAAKEKLLGLHDKNVVIEFNDQKAVTMEHVETRGNQLPGLNIESLSLQERIELLSLIQESRTVPIEGIQRVVIKKTVIEMNPETGGRYQSQKTINVDNIQEITFEEMPPDVVSKMKEEVVVKEVIEEDSGVKVIDARPPIDDSKNLRDLQVDIQKNMLEQFKEALKKNKKRD
jgi:hypothetical protein